MTPAPGARRVSVPVPGGELAALSWGPEEGPLAVLLHGFPDSAWTWRKLAPALAGVGWRVVAPWTRGYAPSSVPSDGSFHIGALMADAVAVCGALSRGNLAVLVGHDWGALTANALGAHPASPYAAVVSMAVPPLDAVRPRLDPLLLAGQLRRSWYIGFNQLPVVAERSLDRLVPRLWRDWSPGYGADEDVRHALEAIRGRESAVLGYYRALVRSGRPPAVYRDWHSTWRAVPTVPTLYLHGAGDGCLSPTFAADVGDRLVEGSSADVLPDAGHFLHLEQPQAVAELVMRFLESVRLQAAR